MRKHLGFGVVLALASLNASVGAAYGQTRGAGAAANANNIGAAVNTAVTGSPTMPGQAGGVGANTAVPGNVQIPGTAGNVANQLGVTGANPANAAAPGIGQGTYPGTATGATTGYTNRLAPYNAQAPGTAGNVGNQANQMGTTGTNPANAAAPGVVQGTYPGTATGATPGYTSRVMPGMEGYNSVNPMATTMAPSYYYAGTAGMPYATYNTPGYVTPGTYSTTTGPYVVQRRGLFGRRNRVAYPASPYGYTTYGTTPSGYTTYGTTTYSTTPGTYSYGSPMYTTPGRYSYGTYPY